MQKTTGRDHRAFAILRTVQEPDPLLSKECRGRTTSEHMEPVRSRFLTNERRKDSRSARVMRIYHHLTSARHSG